MHQQLNVLEDGDLAHLTEDFAVGQHTHTLCEKVVDAADGSEGACMTCYSTARRCEAHIPDGFLALVFHLPAVAA